MEIKNDIGKPMSYQIIDEMFSIIKKQKHFDAETIAGLESLWTSGNLQRSELVIQVIKPNPEE